MEAAALSLSFAPALEAAVGGGEQRRQRAQEQAAVEPRVRHERQPLVGPRPRGCGGRCALLLVLLAELLRGAGLPVEQLLRALEEARHVGGGDEGQGVRLGELRGDGGAAGEV